MTENLVIGSGPAGVALASALLARGRQVLMIDGGKRLEPADPALQARLAASEPGDWSDHDRDVWQHPQFETPPGQVRRFGSDAAVEPWSETFANSTPAIAQRASLARGGLSMVWGAAVAPYQASDMAGWPITQADLAPHYRAVAEFLPLAGGSAPDLPGHPGPGPGQQAQTLLERAMGGDLRGGVRLLPARTAVAPGCKSCGQCLHGCPWALIWNAGHRLDALAEMPGFAYQAGPPVVAITENGDGTQARLADGSTIEAKRIFVAAGVLQTARLVLGMGFVRRLVLRDSQFAFLPMLHLRAAPDLGPLTTLPQLFAEIEQPDISPFLIHGQIYGWNEFYARDLTASYGRYLPGGAGLWRALARRMMVAQVFLHSDHSATINLELGPDDRLIAEATANADFAPRVAKANRVLGRAMRPLGLTALQVATRLGEPGASFHTGASLPMAQAPRGAEADLLGRPAGLQNIHIVDATVLPAIAASTITLTVMANAHRIGTLADG